MAERRKSTDRWFDLGLFVGRQQALDRLHEIFQGGARLVTVTGPEGIGKSRVAARYAAVHEARYTVEGGGVYACDLADATSGEEAMRKLAGALDAELSAAPGVDPVESLAAVLDDKSPVLVVLDHADRVAGELKATLLAWLEGVPRARFLVTARNGLGLDREVRVKLGPLRAPPKTARGVDEVAGYDGVSLFVERARQAVRGWTLKAVEAEAVAEIVRRVGGVPLAIELAAARLAAFSPGEILERLPSRVELLKQGERTPSSSSSSSGRRARSAGAAKKRGGRSTLSSTIEWSWRLLKPWEQAALAQTSVFRGGFSVEAAEAVLDLDEYERAPSVADALRALRDKSLLRRASGSLALGKGRLTHYAPIRDFAEAELERARQAARVKKRHAAYYLALGAELAADVDAHGGIARRRQLEQEAENLMAVVRTALAADPLTVVDVERALQGLLVLEPVLATRGPFNVHLMLLDMALDPAEVLDVDPLLYARALESRGRARRVRGRAKESLADLERALELARRAGDRVWEARALGNIGTHHLQAGDLERAEARYDEALPLMRAEGARLLEGRCTAFMAGLYRRRGAIERAREHLEAGLEVHREVGDRRYEGITLGELGALWLDLGQPKRGIVVLERALAIHREVGNRRFEGLVLNELARGRFEQGRFRDAAALCEEGIRIHRDVLDRKAEGVARSRLGDIDVQAGRLDEARTQYDLAATLQQSAGDLAGAALTLAKCACVEATQGARALARESLRDAEEIVARLDDTAAHDAFRLYRAHVLGSDLAPISDGDDDESTQPDSRIGDAPARTTAPGAHPPEAVRMAAATVSALKGA